VSDEQCKAEQIEKLRNDISREFEQARENDPCFDLLRKYRGYGVSEIDALKGLVAILSNLNRNMAAELARVEAIAPKLYRTPSGKHVRWDAPDKLLPAIPLDGEIVPGKIPSIAAVADAFDEFWQPDTGSNAAHKIGERVAKQMDEAFLTALSRAGL
jgi:hypothetical protein